jgi:glycosyltransferase involved in cell wall biosynthesis
MKVALLTNFIAPYRLPLLEDLRNRVGDFRVFLSTPMEADRQWEVNWGKLDVTVQRNLSWGARYHDSLGFSRNLQIHLPYDTIPQLSRFQPDVVISAELGMRSAQAALYRTLKSNTSLLIWATLSEHSERDWGIARRVMRRSILSRADGVLVNGESGARYIRSFGMPDQWIFRVNQPVDVDIFAGVSGPCSPASTRRLLYVGALSPRKGLVGFMRILLSWAANNRDKAIEINWLGEGDDRRALSAMDLPNHVTQHFLGNRPYHDLARIYAAADVLFFPTLMDEWGLVVNEGMASGLPVLGSIYSQAVEELIEDGVTGWTFDPIAEKSVIAALDRSFAVPSAKLKAMGDAGRRRIMTLTPASASERIVNAMQVIRDRRSVTGAIAPHLATDN